VRIVGDATPGRPALFGTTSGFLETFGLSALSDLPPLREVESLISALPPAERLADEAADEIPSEAAREDAAPVLDEEIRFH
jgi:segregation and condensation protein B